MQPVEFQFSDRFEVTRDGVYPNAAAGVEQVIDRVGRNTMVAKFDGDGRDLLIDEDHFSLDPGKSSRALGWVTKLFNESDRLMAQARWSGAGVEALRAGNFRFCSPVFNRTENLGGTRVRPIELHSIGLTNSPVMRGDPISNRLIMNRASDLTFSGERITNRRAADIFSAVVREHQRDHKQSFTDAWNQSRLRFPLLNALMMMPNTSEGVLLNRNINPFKPGTDAEQAKYWAAVEKAADKVRERVASPTRLYRRGDDSDTAAFGSVWDEAFAAAGGDRARAFDWIRDHHPEIFGNFVLNSPEAAQFL